MNWLIYIAVAAIGYCLGNFSTGLIVGRHMAHIDIREHGSGSAGTTNILRTLGWLPSSLTLLGDVLKALIAGFIGLWLGSFADVANAARIGAIIGGVAAIAGHNWPAFLGFKGGKGIAASLGAILVVDPWIALILVVVQVGVLVLTRYMSAASLISVTTYFAITLIAKYGSWWDIGFAFVIMAMAIYCHRENIARLKNRNENRLDFSKIKKMSVGK